MYSPSKQIDENNIKIAQFLGIPTLEKEELIVKGIYKDVTKIPFLRFDKSFDWQMVAICYLNNLDYSIQIVDGVCVVQEPNSAEPIVWNSCKKDVTVEELREVVFRSIVETIEEYYTSTSENATELTIKQFNEWNLEEEDVE